MYTGIGDDVCPKCNSRYCDGTGHDNGHDNGYDNGYEAEEAEKAYFKAHPELNP